MLYLMKNEEAPADMILLDSNEIKDKQSITYVNNILVTG